jgi:hypothetical protein
MAARAMKTAAFRKPAKIESRLSMALVSLLVIVAAGVFLRQFQVNPAVVALRPEAHPLDQSPSAQTALIDVTDSGVSPFSPPERFSPETLYEKINGRADLYLASGFVALETQRFSMNAAGGSWVEVFVYDMATAENAFSVFSMQRRQDARTDDRMPNAYRTENALFMTHANFYLEFIGTDSAPALQQAMETLASRFVQAQGGGERAHVPGADLFPPDGMRPATLQLITANAFGYEQLDQVYTCEYDHAGSPLTAFVSPRPDAEAAAALAADYQGAMVSFGAMVVDHPKPLAPGVVLQLFDTYEIIFSRGRYLAGVHEADNLEAAASLARRVASHLEQSHGQ